MEMADGGVLKLADLLAQESGERIEAAPKAADIDDHGRVREIGGRRDGPDPTRYGDWEKNGRCIDF